MMQTPHIQLPSISNLPFPTRMDNAVLINLGQSLLCEQLPIFPKSGVSSEDENQTLPRKMPSSDDKKNNKHPISVKGSWSPREDEQLRIAVSKCQPILWDVVAEQVPGRSAIQCKERWLYRLHPEVKKTRFEKWEDDIIIKARNIYGNHWTLIANKLPGRTSCAVKNRWYSVLRNKISRQSGSLI
jgi:hypothetical protein